MGYLLPKGGMTMNKAISPHRRPRVMLISVHGDPGARPGGIQTGGQNIYVRKLALELSRRGWEVDVFTHHDDPASPAREALGGARIIRLSAGRLGFIPKDDLFGYLPQFVAEVGQFCARDPNRQSLRAYDVIHSNYWISGWVGSRLREESGVPQVHTSHSLGAMKARGLDMVPEAMRFRLRQEKSVLRGATLVIATSPYEKGVLEQEYGVNSANIRVVPCGFDPRVFHPFPIEERARLDLAGHRVVLFAGRFAPQKGLPFLLEAFKLLVERHPGEPLRLLLAGGDPVSLPPAEVSPEKKDILGHIERLSLEERVTFLGPVEQGTLARYFSATDVCAIPSVYEPFGMVALEAMACGCPVVASEVGGLAFTVRHGDSGLLVPPKDPRRLAVALESVLFDDRLRRRLASGALRRAGQEFSWEAVTDGIEGLYREVMEGAAA